MDTWKFVIKSKKQSNGVWGMPMSCVKLDKIYGVGLFALSNEDWLKSTAFCVAIAEAYPDETFEILMTSEKGFFVKLEKSGMQKLFYQDYDLTDNVLTWIGSDDWKQNRT